MAEETAPEIVDPNTTVAATVDMEVENVTESKEKRSREEEEEPKDDVVSKKAKVDEEKSVEEERLEKLEKNEGDEKEEKETSGDVKLGPKTFGSSLDMFHYFHKFLHAWPQNLNVNKVFLCFILFYYQFIQSVFFVIYLIYMGWSVVFVVIYFN